MVYLVAAAAVGTVVVGTIGIGAAEAWGPTSERTGRLLDTEVGEREVCTGTGTTRRCRMVDTFEVVGEYENGTTFTKKGEDPYRAVRGETGAIAIETSDLTGRIVSLDSSSGSWQERPGMYLFVGSLFTALWVALIVAFETKRRRGETDIGSFRRPEWLAIVPGMVLGLVPLTMLGLRLSPSAGSSQSSEGSERAGSTPAVFLENSFNYALVQAEAGEGPGIAVNETFRLSPGASMSTVGLEHLNAAEIAAWQSADVFAVPLLQEGNVSGPFNIVTFLAGNPGNVAENVRCPEGLRSFKEEIAPGPIYGGFVCFAPEFEGMEFHVTVGSRQLTTEDFRPAYQRSDGTTVEN